MLRCIGILQAGFGTACFLKNGEKMRKNYVKVKEVGRY